MKDLLEHVGSFRYHPEAAAAKALLEAEGIPAVLANVHSGDLWTGAVSEIRIEVLARDAARARGILDRLMDTARRERERARAGATDREDACLRCGAPMPPEARTCPSCRFSFEGEERVEYEDGPIPASMLARIWSPLWSRRAALPASAVPDYVAWCARAGIEITGWESWWRGILGRSILDIRESGTGQELLAALAELDADLAGRIYFAIRAAARAEPAARDD